MPLYTIPPRHFTDAAGNIRADVVENEALAQFGKILRRSDGVPYRFKSLEDAREATQRAAKFEQWDIAEKTRANAAWERQLAAEEAEVQQIAAAHGYNIETLTFEVERRNFGSFTTTGEGSPERRAIYDRALAFARSKQHPYMEAAE